MTEKDIFDDLMSDMGDLFADVDEEAEDLSRLDSPALVDIIYKLTEELLQMGQGLNPTTQEARDMHSRRNACQVILRERGVQV